MTASCHADNALFGLDIGLYPRTGNVHLRVAPPAMTCNRALAYETRQLLFDRFKHGGEFGLLFPKQPAHVSPVFPGRVSDDHWPAFLLDRHFSAPLRWPPPKRPGTGAVLAHLDLQQ